MIYTTKIKVCEDEKLIKEICTKLDKLAKSIIHIDPNFIDILCYK